MFEKEEYNEPEEEREVESSRSYDFIEETSKGLHINDYEKDAFDKKLMKLLEAVNWRLI